MLDNRDEFERKPDVTLSPEDAAAVDRILDHGADAGQAGAQGSAERETRVQEWLKLVGTAPVPAVSADLADRTLAIIERERMKLQPVAAGVPGGVEKDLFARPIRRRWSRKVAEIGAMAIAASLLLAVVLLGVGQAKQSKARVACDENLRRWSQAVTTYATSYSNALPSLAMPADHNWLKAQDPNAARSNSSNVSPLLTGNYISLANLYCAGAMPAEFPSVEPNNLGQIGYSYTYMYGPVRPTWDGNHATIVMADRNPMFVSGAVTSAAKENSPNHGGHGNYVLRADGAVTWEVSPNAGFHGDNIWTVNKGAEKVITYIGTEQTASSADTFVCP